MANTTIVPAVHCINSGTFVRCNTASNFTMTLKANAIWIMAVTSGKKNTIRT
jgi:hypothetical protein